MTHPLCGPAVLPDPLVRCLPLMNPSLCGHFVHPKRDTLRLPVGATIQGHQEKRYRLVSRALVIPAVVRSDDQCARCPDVWEHRALLALQSRQLIAPRIGKAKRRTVEAPPDHRALSGSDLVRGDTANSACMAGDLQAVATVAGALFCRDRRHLRPSLTLE